MRSRLLPFRYGFFHSGYYRNLTHRIKIKNVSYNELCFDQDLVISSGSISGYYNFWGDDFFFLCNSDYCQCELDGYEPDYECDNGFCYPRYTREEKREILIDIILDGYEEFDYFNQYNTIGDFMGIKND